MRCVAASWGDLRRIGDIVRSAQRSLAELGIDQWQDGYPSEEIIADDIAAGEGYVILADDGSVAAYGAVKVGREADYDDIRGGAWRYDGEYVVVHRLCVAEPHRRSGLASMFFACAAQIARRSGRDIIRVDTHQGNVRMLSLLDKEGFGRCGTIRCRSGVRTAFDRRVAPPRIAVREAVPDDCYIISDAVTAAFGEDLCRRLCRDASPQRIRGFFAEVAAMPATQYSFENTIVCTVDGVAAGAICGYDGARLDELRSPVLDMLRERFGSAPSPIENETCAGEFYLDSIGIDPLFRGTGAGTALLRAMIERARRSDAGCAALLVDVENPHAERLYRRVGFCRSGTRTLLGHNMYVMTIR